MTLALHVKGYEMNLRIATFVATLSLLATAGGCSGMKNFLFGRGAACGPCAGPNCGVAPRPEPVCGFEPVCGQEPVCGHEPVCGYEQAPVRPFAGLRRGCGLLGGQGTCSGSPSCGCGGSTQSYMPSGVDAHYGEVHDPYAHGGEVIGSQVIGDSYNGYPTHGTIVPEGVVPGTVYPGTSSDNFDARGSQIINGSPMPSVVTQP
jgi:hypothetical protein